MGVRVVAVSFHVVKLRTRMPFRYGIAELRETPHLFVRAEVEVGGKVAVGLAADNLPPKWFTKDPATTYEEDLVEMVGVIRAAGRHAVELGEMPSVEALWRGMYVRQGVWAGLDGRNCPPLLWHFGVSLIERAAIDAVCRRAGVAFHDAIGNGLLGNVVPAGVLAVPPATSIAVRHTVGLSDPLTDDDVLSGERLDDGLPQTLEQTIRTYGLTHFKIKLSGDVGADLRRLRRLAGLLEKEAPAFRHTLDGNENFRDLPSFRELWGALTSDPELSGFLNRLMFVEQPLHRAIALDVDLKAWEDRPPIIIDESDDTMGAIATAVKRGYAGTSYKSCKGILKGVTNAAYLARLRREQPGRTFILSGEDLTNVGPVALLQDLAVLAALGVSHAERNGQHYLRGLDQFSADVQEAVLAAHPDLYRRHERGFATLDVRGGRMSLGSVNAAPFGYANELDVRRFPLLDIGS